MPATVGVIQQFAHPPLALMRSVQSVDNPFLGEGEFSADDLGGYGLVWHVQYVPQAIGVTDGYIYRYSQRLFQLSVEHSLLPGSGDVTTQLVESDLGDGLFWYESTLPSHIHYWIFPYVQINFSLLLL